MRVLLVSISLEFPLANYCLAAQILASPGLRGCQVDLVDLDWARISSYERKNAEIWRYVAGVEKARPDAIGFSTYLWNHIAVRELITITRALFPSIRIVIGGPELSTQDAAQSWLQSGTVDVAVRGEGERTMEEVIQRFAQGDGTRGVEGTSRYEGGRVEHELDRAPIKHLGELASPYLTGLVSPELFARNGVNTDSNVYPRVLIETYRGCYMQCSYCQWGNGSSARFAFPESRLQREFTWLLTNNVKAVFIVDAMFGFKKSVAIGLLDYIVSEKRRLGAQTRFSLYHNQDFFDPELLNLYREAEAFVEVDIQSTSNNVLKRLGRSRWKTDSFERHVGAIREQGVPTTGAADLIIGIPGDTLNSFEDSVDFLLRHHMRVNLYQASLLPGTGWSRSVVADGTVSSPIPPRAIMANATFPLSDMIKARLIGHGTDLFNSFPRTAHFLWKGWFGRPVDLCRVIGNAVFREHGLMYGESHQHNWELGDHLDALEALVRGICPDERKAAILGELFKFEGALAAATWATKRNRVVRKAGWSVSGDHWLAEHPRFERECVQAVTFHYDIKELVLACGPEPEPSLLDAVLERPHTVLFYSDGRAQHLAIDRGITERLLARFTGHFSVAEVFDNIALRLPDLAPVWSMLSVLAASGLIVPGEVEGRDERRHTKRRAEPLHNEPAGHAD